MRGEVARRAGGLRVFSDSSDRRGEYGDRVAFRERGSGCGIRAEHRSVG